MSEQLATSDELKVFVSYSRGDVAFADQLVQFLESRGFDAIIDRHDIDPGDKWKDRLGDLIFRSDVVVFVLTETSANSPICQWEVDKAVTLGKRMIPLTIGPLDGVTPPAQLADLNYIYFYSAPDKPGSGFFAGTQELETALKVDLGWMRQQTRLSAQAEAHRDNPVDANLIRGEVLEGALTWVSEKPIDAVVLPEVLAFIESSEKAETERKAAAEAQLAEREAAVLRAQEAVEKEQFALAQAEEAVTRQAAADRKRRRATLFGAITAGVIFVFGLLGTLVGVNLAVDAEEKLSSAFAASSELQSDEGNNMVAMHLALMGDPLQETGASAFLGSGENSAAKTALEHAYTHNRLLTSDARGSPILDMAINPADPETYITASIDYTVRLWRVGQAQPVQIYTGHQNWVRSVAFHPDGEMFLTGSDDGTANLWRVDQTEPIKSFVTDRTWVTDAVFHPDGEHVLIAEGTGVVRNWPIDGDAPARLVARLNGSFVNTLAVHPDGQSLLTGNSNGKISLWSLAPPTEAETAAPELVEGGEAEPLEQSLVLLNEFSGHQDQRDITALAFAPGGEYFLSGSVDNTAKLWHIANSNAEQTLSGHQGFVRSVAFHPNRAQMITGSDDGTAKVWTRGFNDPVQSFGDQAGITAVALDPAGRHLLTASMSGNAKRWLLGEDRLLQTFEGHFYYVTDIAFHPDGDKLLTGAEDYTAKLWEIGSSDAVQTFGASDAVDFYNDDELFEEGSVEGHYDYVTSVTFHPDGERLLTGSADSTAKLWRIGQDAPLQTFSAHDDYVNAVAFHPDGERFATGSDDQTAILWRIGEDEPLQTFGVSYYNKTYEDDVEEGHDDYISSLAFHPGGELLITGSEDGTAKLWQIGVENELQTFEGHADYINAVDFSPDGTLIATGSDDGTIRVWELETGETIQILSGHAGGVQTVEFHPDGLLLLSGATDRTAKLWRLGEGLELQTFDGHGDWISAVTFSADGSLIATTSDDGTAKLWEIEPFLLLEADSKVNAACEYLANIGMPFLSETDRESAPILRELSEEELDPCGHRGSDDAGNIASASAAGD